jgi:chemotaxis protein CheZ
MSADPKDKREKVVQLINSVIKKVEAKEEVSREQIYQELLSLHLIIEETRQDISAVRVAEINNKHIPSSTDELDAVVQATEIATSTIMDSCESLQAYSEQLDSAHKDFIVGEITKILEACTFQDITGQRITKVIKNLKTIDQKINSLLVVLHDKIPGLPEGEEEGDKRVGDARLMNGPQMPDKAINQDDIDKLLADLF